MKRKFVGLCRISTLKQAKEGNSIEEQSKSISRYADSQRGELVEIVKVQASGKKQLLNVGQLSETIKKAKLLGAEIICSKIDRLSRDQITLLMLRKASTESGVEIHVSSINRKISEISDLEFSLIAVIAEQERKTIAQRTKEASKNRVGPIGQTLDAVELGKKSVSVRAKLTSDWADSVNLKMHICNAFDMLRHPTQSSVAKWLNGEGVLTIRGNRWTAVNLCQQLDRLGWKWGEFQQT
jgi:hypothetical protein